MEMSKFYPLTVSSVRHETRDSVVLTLDVPTEHEEAFRFQQGQYLTFRTKIDGEEVRRSYSICAAVQDTHLRVGIKKVADGRFSTWANEQIAVGDVLEVMPPMGSFFVPLDPANEKHYVAFAGGSGITPVLGIVKTTLLSEPRSSFTLFYGNRASSTIMFREELEDIKNNNLGRFQLVHILEREKQDVDLFNGILNREKCELLLKYWVNVSDIDTAFICGPEAMMLQVSEALQAAGLDKRQIKFELFASPSQSPKGIRKVQTAAVSNMENACQATIVIDGRARTIDMQKGTKTILDAALGEGLELPYACKGGVCSTCRALLSEGEVDMDANFALEDYEIQRGYILTCQSYPVTDKILVDFDQ
jgi:ring-1,2-phenylacetyl-CoA epoxidase subunit PaaE